MAGTVSLRAGTSTTIPNLLLGSRCTVTEQADTLTTAPSASDPSWVWLPPTYSPGQEVVVSSATAPLTVTVTNAIKQVTGSFLLSKAVTGAGKEGGYVPGTTFTFQVTCTNGLNETVVLADGANWEAPDLPSFISCTVTETGRPPTTPAYGWEPVQFSVNGTPSGANDSVTFTIPNDPLRVQVIASNTITPRLGSVRVTKTVTGLTAGLAPGAPPFPVTLICGVGRTYTLQVPAGGSATQNDIPVGSTCTASEATPTEGLVDDSYAWGAPVYTPPDATVTVADGTTATIGIENPIVRVTVPVTLVKTFSGPQGVIDPARTYPVTWSCTYGGTQVAGGQVNIVVDPAGITVADAVPVTSTCTATEGDLGTPSPDPAFRWEAPVITGTTVTAAGPNTVTVANTLTRDSGTVFVRKQVIGEVSGYVGTGEDFTLHGSCYVPGHPEIPRRYADGTIANNGEVPITASIGWTCCGVRGHAEPVAAQGRLLRLGSAHPGSSGELRSHQGSPDPSVPRPEPDRAGAQLVRHRQERRRPERDRRPCGHVHRRLLLPVRHRRADHRTVEHHPRHHQHLHRARRAAHLGLHRHRGQPRHDRPAATARGPGPPRWSGRPPPWSPAGPRRSPSPTRSSGCMPGCRSPRPLTDPDGGVLPGAQFTGVWKCRQGGTDYSDRFTVGPNATTTLFTPPDQRVPATSVCSVTEDTPDPAKLRDGSFAWDKPVLSPPDIALVAGQTANLGIANTVIRVYSDVTITKVITGPALGLVDPARKYTGEISCQYRDDAPIVATWSATTSTPSLHPGVLVGSVCTAIEDPPGATGQPVTGDRSYVWEPPVISDPVTVTPPSVPTPPLVVTNPTKRLFGTFTVAKSVTGATEGIVDPSQPFPMSYICEPGTGEAIEGTLDVPATQTRTVGPERQIPVASVCTLTEPADGLPALIDSAWNWNDPTFTVDGIPAPGHRPDHHLHDSGAAGRPARANRGDCRDELGDQDPWGVHGHEVVRSRLRHAGSARIDHHVHPHGRLHRHGARPRRRA